MMRYLKAGLVLLSFGLTWDGEAKARAGLISSLDGNYTVGLDDSGALVDNNGIGFLRNSDGFDPIIPGTPRDSWGISANGVGSYADPYFYGITANEVSATYGANSATIVTTDMTGSLLVTQNYSFAANNVLVVQTTVTNISGVSVAALFQRVVDFDVFPTPFSEITNIPAAGPPVIDTSFYGFESPNPLDPFFASGFPGGGTFGPSDFGAGIKIDLGTLTAGASTSFNFYYADNLIGQSPSSLTDEVAGLGANTILTTYSSDGDFNTATNSAILGFSSVPEPNSLVGLGTAIVLSAIGYRVRRRKPKLA